MTEPTDDWVPDEEYVAAIRDVATRVFEHESETDPDWTVADLPDCFDCCELFTTALADASETPISVPELLESRYLTTKTRTVSLPDEYTHYVVETRLPSMRSYIVDAAFGQFAAEVDTPITVAPGAETDHVVVVKKPLYVFTEHINEHPW